MALRLDGLHRLERLVINDAQMWRLGDLVLVLRVWPGDPLSDRRVFHHANLVPDDGAGIEIVQQDAAAASIVAVDARCAPTLPSRGSHTAFVERLCDRTRRLAGDVVGENLAHDLGLDDFQTRPDCRHQRDNRTLGRRRGGADYTLKNKAGARRARQYGY
jgi:hypothetical protein